MSELNDYVLDQVSTYKWFLETLNDVQTYAPDSSVAKAFCDVVPIFRNLVSKVLFNSFSVAYAYRQLELRYGHQWSEAKLDFVSKSYVSGSLFKDAGLGFAD